MRTIWKYSFEVTDEFEIQMPFGAYILDVQLQDNTPCMWAVVDPDEPGVSRKFRVFGTGNPFDLDGEYSWYYIGTFQSPPFVWHVFEDFNRPVFEEE